MSRIGGGQSVSAGNNGRLMVTLKPRSERPPVEEVVRELRRDLAGIPGLKVFPQNPPTVRIGGMQTKSLYQFTLFGPELNQLYARGRKDGGADEESLGIIDVTTDLQITNLEVLVDINRDKASTPRHQRGADRADPRQRLRGAADLHDLHAEQPVPCHHRGGG